MKYRFSDLLSDKIFSDASVIIAAGKYPIFNNMAIDKLRKAAKGEIDELGEIGNSILGEFETSESENISLIGIDDFLEYSKIQPIAGKWFCSVDYKELTNKQRKAVEAFIKNPNPYGALAINSTDWGDYGRLLKARYITSNPKCHILQLNFPYRDALKQLITELFDKRGVKVVDKAVDLFIMRMSTAYDEYEEKIDNICKDLEDKYITYDIMLSKMKGINNYLLDDLITQLLVPIGSKNINSRRKIYKMIAQLEIDMEPQKLVKAIGYRIDDMLELRREINKGTIPVLVRYSTEEVQSKLDEDSKLRRLSDKTFKMYAYVASQTSLNDWLHMKMIIDRARKSHDTELCERVLITLVHRGILNDSRIANDIGLCDIFKDTLYDIDTILYRLPNDVIE